MNYDKAYELARAIRESDEYTTFVALQTKLNEQPEIKQMLDEFRNRQFELQMKQMQGQQVLEQEMEQMKRLYDTINVHNDVHKLLEAERMLQLVMEDVNRIIMEPLQELYSEQ